MDLLFWIGPLVALFVGGGMTLYFILPDLRADTEARPETHGI